MSGLVASCFYSWAATNYPSIVGLYIASVCDTSNDYASLDNVIVDEMIIDKTLNPKGYLGTPDDQRMVVKEFGPVFGGIHMGTGSTTSGDRVKELTFI